MRGTVELLCGVSDWRVGASSEAECEELGVRDWEDAVALSNW